MDALTDTPTVGSWPHLAQNGSGPYLRAHGSGQNYLARQRQSSSITCRWPMQSTIAQQWAAQSIDVKWHARSREAQVSYGRAIE